MLIVEDEYLLAHDLSRYFREMGAVRARTSFVPLTQPVPTVAYADAAILGYRSERSGRVSPGGRNWSVAAYPLCSTRAAANIVIPHRFQFVRASGKAGFDPSRFPMRFFPPTIGRNRGRS